jgi:hypothetical protein
MKSGTWLFLSALAMAFVALTSTRAFASVGLNFDINASGTTVRFAKGYPTGEWVLESSRKTVLPVFVQARFMRQSPSVMRFYFNTPVEVEILDDGKSSTVLFRQIDLDLGEEGLQAFLGAATVSAGDLMVRNEYALQQIRDFITQAEGRSSLEPMAHEVPPAIMIPEQTYTFTLKYEDFISGVPVKVNPSVRMNFVEAYDAQKNTLYLEGSTTQFLLQELVSAPILKIEDEQTKRFLDLRQKIMNIRRKMIGFSVGTFTKGGINYVVIDHKKPDHNVIRPAFGQKRSCDSDLKEN